MCLGKALLTVNGITGFHFECRCSGGSGGEKWVEDEKKRRKRKKEEKTIPSLPLYIISGRGINSAQLAQPSSEVLSE